MQVPEGKPRRTENPLLVSTMGSVNLYVMPFQDRAERHQDCRMVLEHNVRRKEELKMAFPLASIIALQTTIRTTLHSLNTTRQNAETIQHLTAKDAKDDSKHHASQAQHKQSRRLVESVYDIEPSIRKRYLLDFCCRRDPHLKVHVIGKTVAFQVRCWNCGKTSYMFDSPDKAVKQWNEMNDD